MMYYTDLNYNTPHHTEQSVPTLFNRIPLPYRWKSPVTPGDQLIMEMSLVGFDERLGFATMTGKAYVGGRVRITSML
jgi:hypothetical protein